MAGAYVDIQPAILDWVIQRAQFEDVGSDIFDKLYQWRAGIKKPTFSQIEDMSRKTHIPFGYFFLRTPPVEDIGIVDYRTVNSDAIQHPSRDLLDTVNVMRQAQDWMVDHCKENGFDMLPFVGRFSRGGDHKVVARDIRKELELELDWFIARKDSADSFRYLRERIAASGVMVMKNGIVGNNTHRKLKVTEFRAFTLINEYAPLIFINSNDAETGMLFSLLHELTHVWIGRDSLYNEPHGNRGKISELEQACNATTAEILVPDMIFKEQWRSLSGDVRQKVEQLSKRYFKCSRFVIALKALNNGFIDQGTFNGLLAGLEKDYQQELGTKSPRKDKEGGPNFYKVLASKLDHRFVLALAESAKSGEISYTDAYRLTGTSGKTFNDLVQKVRGE